MPEIPLAEQSDIELIQAARQDDEAAFGILVNRYLPSVYAFCLRYTSNPPDADDVAQETFVKAWRHLGRFDLEKSFKTWLFAIAKNTATDIMRKRRTVAFSQFDTEDDSNVLIDTLTDTEPLPEEIFDEATRAEDVRKALSELKPRDQTILELRYREELSFEEISQLLSIPANTVRSLHRRALMALRKSLASLAGQI
ncbi:MAG: sigma-70 family RNA polymerase sigma factor [Candidatus Pacebacteria bacterium]|nr:sigma-70 family RNA polymerase sigma factor [Candidatus Paceibacterota bacterium]